MRLCYCYDAGAAWCESVLSARGLRSCLRKEGVRTLLLGSGSQV